MANDRTLRLIFSGRDESGNAVKSVTQSLKELKTAVREGKADLMQERQAYSDSIRVMRERVKEERLLRMEYRQNHETMFKTIQTVQTVGNAALKVNQLFISHSLLQNRIKDNNEGLKESFMKLIDAQNTYGRDSVQAFEAHKDYNQMLQEQKELQRESATQAITYGVSVAGIAADIALVTGQLVSWKRARAGAFDVDFKKGNTIADDVAKETSKIVDEPLSKPYRTTSNPNAVDEFIQRNKGNFQSSAPLNYAKMQAEYNKFYNSPVKGGMPGADIVPEAGLSGRFAGTGNKVLSGFNRAGGNEIAAIASIVTPIALASAEVDRFLEQNAGINISRASEDKMLFERGLPDHQTLQEFYNEYDRTGGNMDVHITIVDNSGRPEDTAEKTAEKIDQFAKNWSSQWG